MIDGRHIHLDAGRAGQMYPQRDRGGPGAVLTPSNEHFRLDRVCLGPD